MYRYPNDLNGENQACVIFTGYDRIGKMSDAEIALFMPNNHAVADGASYNNFDLGVLGEAGARIAESVFTGGGLDEAALRRELNSATGGNNPTMSKVLNSQVMTNFGMGSGIVDRGRDLYLQKAELAINPNTVLQYSNSTLRAYNFQFKLVANSKREAETINKIVNSFRKYMYPDKADEEGKTLTYPLKWDITFLAPDGKENMKFPKPYECYLESLSAVYNATGNALHYDGSPIEVDVSLAFKETKTLSREDIIELQ